MSEPSKKSNARLIEKMNIKIVSLSAKINGLILANRITIDMTRNNHIGAANALAVRKTNGKMINVLCLQRLELKNKVNDLILGRNHD